jgi:hypothetical protein
MEFDLGGWNKSNLWNTKQPISSIAKGTSSGQSLRSQGVEQRYRTIGSPYSLMSSISLPKPTYIWALAAGALAAATAYMTTTTRPWITPGVDSAAEDPYILRHYGEL